MTALAFAAVPLWVLALHWVADFVCQTDWMALNKSRRWDALLEHVWVYMAVMLLGVWVVTGRPYESVWFAGVTFVAHFVTDAVTSRIIARLYPFEPISMRAVSVAEKGSPAVINWSGHTTRLWRDIDGLGGHSRHWFFVAVGLDQALHYAQLAWTLRWLGL